LNSLSDFISVLLDKEKMGSIARAGKSFVGQIKQGNSLIPQSFLERLIIRRWNQTDTFRAQNVVGPSLPSTPTKLKRHMSTPKCDEDITFNLRNLMFQKLFHNCFNELP